MEVPFRCPPIPSKGHANRGFLIQFPSQGGAIGQGELRPQMRYHANHRVFTASEMKRTLPRLAVTRGLALKLGKQASQIHPPRCKYAEVTMQGKNKLIGTKGLGCTHGNGFLTDARKPFGHLALTKQNQHFFFNHSRQQQTLVQLHQLCIGAG